VSRRELFFDMRVPGFMSPRMMRARMLPAIASQVGRAGSLTARIVPVCHGLRSFVQLWLDVARVYVSQSGGARWRRNGAETPLILRRNISRFRSKWHERPRKTQGAHTAGRRNADASHHP
jgi:hypothetical protein